jgi:hypothetical protein
MKTSALLFSWHSRRCIVAHHIADMSQPRRVLSRNCTARGWTICGRDTHVSQHVTTIGCCTHHEHFAYSTTRTRAYCVGLRVPGPRAASAYPATVYFHVELCALTQKLLSVRLRRQRLSPTTSALGETKTASNRGMPFWRDVSARLGT